MSKVIIQTELVQSATTHAFGRVEQAAAANPNIAAPTASPMASIVLQAVTAKQERVKAASDAMAFRSVCMLPQNLAFALQQPPRVIAVGLNTEDAIREHLAIAGACRSAGTVFEPTATTLHTLPVNLDSNVADLIVATEIEEALATYHANWLIIGPDVFVGPVTQKAIDQLQRAFGLIVVEPGMANIMARVINLTGDVIAADITSICHAVNAGRIGLQLRARVDGSAVRIRDLYGNEVLVIDQHAGTWSINGRQVKPNIAVVVGAAKAFAPGGDALVAVLNPTSFVSLAIAILALAFKGGGRPKDVIYAWFQGLEMAMTPIDRELAKLDVDGQVYNRDVVLGHYRLVADRDRSISGQARCVTRGLVEQLRRTVLAVTFMPSAKGEFILAFAQETAGLVRASSNGDIELPAKGTKHLDGLHAQTAGRVVLPAVILPGTPIGLGGSMPISESLLNAITAVESKTLLQTQRSWTSQFAAKAAVKASDWKLLVDKDAIIRPGDPIAMVNGKTIVWSLRKGKGAIGAFITKAELIELDVMGQPTLRLAIQAEVVWQGAAKGRQSVKAMLVPMAATGTELLENKDGMMVPVEAALISDGLVKVSASATRLIRKVREGVFVVRRGCTQEVFNLLLSHHGPGGIAEDSRYSFDPLSLTVTIRDKGWLAEVEIGIESQPVHEAVGDASMMLTQMAFLNAADRHCEGAGSEILRDLLLDRVTDRVGLLRYAKANSAGTFGRLPLPDGTHIPVTGWVEYKADGSLAGPQRGFADIAGQPAVAAEFSIDDSDAEVLSKMAERFPWLIVRATDDLGDTYVASIHSGTVLKLAGSQSPGGELAGIGHTSAELIRCVLFPERAKRLTGAKERVGLIRKWRRQLQKLAFSPALNRVHKVKVGISAKVIADWQTPENVVVLHPDGEPAHRLARHFQCRVDDIAGRQVLVARHPVAAMYVATIRLQRSALKPCVLVNEMAWRTRLLGDTDGDLIGLFPVRDSGMAAKLAAGLEKMLPGGDVCMAVTGLSGTDPAHKLFGELTHARPVEAMLNKSVTKPADQWRSQMDGQVHTALAVCGGTYRIVEWAAYLAGLGIIPVDAAVVGSYLYEHRGLAGDVVSDACAEHTRLWAMGIRQNNLAQYAEALSNDLGESMPQKVDVTDPALLGLIVASEMNRIARAGRIPLAQNGSEKFDRLGGEQLAYDPAWRYAALLQAVGRGHVAKADRLLIGFGGHAIQAASPGFLFNLVSLVVSSLGPIVQELSAEGSYGQTDGNQDEGYSSDDGWSEGVEDAFELPEWAE